jgi:hypothetical protein
MIQHKAHKLCDYLLELKDSGNEEELHRTIRGFLELIALRCMHGYGDRDAVLRNNVGFLDGRAIFIDCSHIFLDESVKTPYYFQIEILKAAEKISNWAEQFFPDLAVIIQEEAQDVIDKYLKKCEF